MTAALELNIRKRLDDFLLEVDLAVPEGITAVFGPSGSGKTTLLDLIAGVSTPDWGIIRMEDKDIFHHEKRTNTPPEERGIGYVFQDDVLFPHMTVEANLTFSGKQQKGMPTWQHIVELLGLVDLLDRYPATLSGGEKKRAAIARVLLSGPALIMLDEPLANIDAPRREAFFPYLQILRREFSVPIVYVSHQVDEVLRLADHLVLLDHGKITAAGALAEVFDSPLFQASLGEAGKSTLIEGKVSGVRGGVAALDVGPGTLYSADDRLEAGQDVRLRIMARDVAVSTLKPDGISILNVVPSTVKELEKTFHGNAGLTLEMASDKDEKPVLYAEITQKSAKDLKLKPGSKVYALIKAMAVISPAV